MTDSRFHSEFLPLADTLYRIARYILELGPEAEDAVQELYLKLWESRDSLDGIRQPKAYCIRILKNICLDRIRKARHLTFPERLPETGIQQPQDDEIDSRTRLEKVLEAVKALPERQRQVLVLRAVDGLSYDEISRKTGINYLTCRVLLSQARSKIKTKA
ncbi:MAG: RNA polymerase sigma factor [Bacteroidales bacterium]|nr:RNA polymerase sigma factor [Bacteroidales bacterium]